jgi:predicted component of type VI protein secretion system
VVASAALEVVAMTVAVVAVAVEAHPTAPIEELVVAATAEAHTNSHATGNS